MHFVLPSTVCLPYTCRCERCTIQAANILLARGGHVKLADLGVAAQLYNTMSKRGTMIGTPHWMAPETLAQAARREPEYDLERISMSMSMSLSIRARETPAKAARQHIIFRAR